MSWQAYVDTNLLGTGKIAHAAILGQKGGVWAASSDFKISPPEQDAILKAFTNATHADKLRAEGIRLAGVKYFTLSVEGRTIQGKKGADGTVIVKTDQAILVAVYKGPMQAPEVTPVVESLADYLISMRY